MSRTSKRHHELINGEGKCSVPMWCGGCPAGFCDKPAFGERPPCGQWRNAYTGEMRRHDGKYNGYIPGLACPAHGGPTREEALNLCDHCQHHIAECEGKPEFGCGTGNDNVYECDGFIASDRIAG